MAEPCTKTRGHGKWLKVPWDTEEVKWVNVNENMGQVASSVLVQLFGAYQNMVVLTSLASSLTCHSHSLSWHTSISTQMLRIPWSIWEVNRGRGLAEKAFLSAPGKRNTTSRVDKGRAVMVLPAVNGGFTQLPANQRSKGPSHKERERCLLLRMCTSW